MRGPLLFAEQRLSHIASGARTAWASVKLRALKVILKVLKEEQKKALKVETHKENAEL